MTPLKLQSMGYFPFNTRLTVTGSFTQYCVLGGVLQMILDGYDDIILPAVSFLMTYLFQDIVMNARCNQILDWSIYDSKSIILLNDASVYCK